MENDNKNINYNEPIRLTHTHQTKCTFPFMLALQLGVGEFWWIISNATFVSIICPASELFTSCLSYHIHTHIHTYIHTHTHIKTLLPHLSGYQSALNPINRIITIKSSWFLFRCFGCVSPRWVNVIRLIQANSRVFFFFRHCLFDLFVLRIYQEWLARAHAPSLAQTQMKQNSKPHQSILWHFLIFYDLFINLLLLLFVINCNIICWLCIWQIYFIREKAKKNKIVCGWG